MKRSLFLALLLTGCATTPRATSAPIRDGEGLVRAMHDRYAGRWYRTITFTQKTTRRLPNDSLRVETWLEYGAIPGRLRIEVGDPSTGTGVIYANDSTYGIRGGRLAGKRAALNPLMVLGFDVYAQPVERSLQQLRSEGYPLGTVRRESWNGRPAWVVGGAPGDLHSRQFWVDEERLVFVRSLEPFPGDTSKTMEIRFDDYQPLAGGWIAPTVDVTVDGRSIQREEYSNLRANLPLDPALFDPARWADAPHPAP